MFLMYVGFFYSTERLNWSAYISVHCANRNIVLPTADQTMEEIKTYEVAKEDWKIEDEVVIASPKVLHSDSLG